MRRLQREYSGREKRAVGSKNPSAERVHGQHGQAVDQQVPGKEAGGIPAVERTVGGIRQREQRTDPPPGFRRCPQRRGKIVELEGPADHGVPGGERDQHQRREVDTRRAPRAR